MGMPTIDITFKNLATTAITRSEQGIVCIVVKDDTDNTFKKVTYRTYDSFNGAEKAKFTAVNAAAIEVAFLGSPYSVNVVRIGASSSFIDAAEILNTLKYNWLCLIDETMVEQTAVATYVKSKNQNNAKHKIKAVVYKATAPNDMHVVNFTNDSITYKDGSGATSHYVARLAGLLAGTPFTRSATYAELEELESVAEPEDKDTAIDNGEFILFNDEGTVRVARAVNSLKTLDADHTSDMQKITVIEAMDLIQEDIAVTFSSDYTGKYKNKYDNQCLFLSAVNAYFKDLESEDILDDEYDNIAEIDVETQRSAWIGKGESEADGWSEAEVKAKTFGSKVFLKADIKILDAMEDLEFTITMA